MKKKVLKILAFVVAIALIIGVSVFANALVGNPISKHIATNKAEKILEDKYSDKDFEIEKIVYSFKDGYYHVFIKSPSSIDSSFNITFDMWGNVKFDYYENDVLTGWNTANRIGKEYRDSVDAVFDSKSFPYVEHIGYGDIEFIPEEYMNDTSVPDYAIITEELELDAFYDINELGAKAGKLTIYIDDETVTHERLAEIVLDIKRVFDDAGVGFYAMDLVIEYPKNEDSSKKEGRVEVKDFLYSDIYEEGILERVKESDKAAKEYYAEQDAEKQKLIDEQK